jgi:hypothetical protein
MQRFPQIDENSSTHFPSYRSTDFISNDIPVTTTPTPVQQTTKCDIPITINRSRSCSGGRKNTTLPSTLTRKGILSNKHKSNYL